MTEVAERLVAERPVTTIYRKPRGERGLWSWITTVDHKRIGVMYGYAAFFFFLLGGLVALFLRIHLASANSEFLTAGAYNSLFRRHGTTRICLFVLPVAAPFRNDRLPTPLAALAVR